MNCFQCKNKLLQQGADDKVAIIDLLGDDCNKAWCNVCEILVCSPSEIPMNLYSDCDYLLCDKDGKSLLEESEDH